MLRSPDLVVDGDGVARCPWPGDDPLYRAYHDEEWGVAVRGERPLFERLTLEAFQSGLSWITVLRKRENFRRAFAGFDPHLVARFGPDDRTRLLSDAGLIRNRAKIDATVRNAAAVLRLRESINGGLDALIWSFAPDSAAPAPLRVTDIPAKTAQSAALAKELKRRGFSFVGPTTAYAAMQACGLVDDHLAGCVARRTP